MAGFDQIDGKSRVLAAVNLVELIGQSVKLIRRGNKYVGLCPFHQEKTPSFSVDPGKQFFYCFGCKAGGGAIDFVMKRDRLNFSEALHQLADQFHVDLPRFNGPRESASERQVLFDAQSAAASVFEKALAHPQVGAKARGYLAERGFTDETIKRFQIGLAPDGWDNLLRSEAVKRFSPQQLAAAGLLKTREGSNGFYDTFRNRIMFPIRDEQSRIIAFGGRVMPGSEDPAKYLNSPETPLFSKSRVAYGLDQGKAKIVASRTVAVVEGYTDVMMAHQFGTSNVVSVLGTALTEQHVNLLRRFADRIVLLFDADSAGESAVDRAVELFLTQPLEIAIATLPDGLDPDEFILERGAESFDALLGDATDALSFKWSQLLREFNKNDDLTGQQKAVEAYLEMLGHARGLGAIDPLRWGSVLARVSRLTDIPAERLNQRFKPNRTAARAPVRTQESDVASQPVQRRQMNARDRAESWVLGVLLAEPNRWQDVQQLLGPQDFTDPRRQQLAQVYWNHQRDEGQPQLVDLLASLEDEQIRQLAIDLHTQTEQWQNLSEVLDQALNHLHQQRFKEDGDKLLSALKRSNVSDTQADDEVNLLRQLQQRAKQTDIHRNAS